MDGRSGSIARRDAAVTDAGWYQRLVPRDIFGKVALALTARLDDARGEQP